MDDETYSFISDVKDKGITARSAKSRNTHTRGGKVRLPSDNLSKKELMKMNGECKSYRLNDPMSWQEFISMPDDLKVTYIKLLRQKFNVPDKNIAEMFGINKDYIYRKFKALGLGREVKTSHPKWDKEGYYSWWRGADKLPTPVNEEPEPCEPNPVKPEEPETFVEDDLPFEEPDPVPEEQRIVLCAQIDVLEKRVDELLKSNEELVAVHEKDKAEIAWLRNECDRHRMDARILEAQMEVVRMIFGGANHD